MCPNIWGTKGNVYRILLYVYRILLYVSRIAWVIRINTIHHNKLLPSSLDRYHRHRKCYHRHWKCYHRHWKCYHRHRGMLSSSSGNTVIVIGECCHRHRGMLSSSSGNAIIVNRSKVIFSGVAIIVNRGDIVAIANISMSFSW